MGTDARLRIGLIGLGVISRFYRAALRHSTVARLVAICDRDPRALAAVPEDLPRYTEHAALLAAGGLDAVVVTVPNDAHARICRDALVAGLPVCVEKPLAHRLADGAELARLAADRGLVLFTAFHRRYNDAVAGLRRRLADAVPVESLTVRYFERIEDHVGRDRWYLDPARTGGGCVADNGPNAYDLVRLFLGELMVRQARLWRDSGGLDRRAVVDLGSTSGQPARVELDWAFPGERKDLTVRLVDGSTHTVDMLAGHPGFKSSLWHEYEGVLGDFVAAVAGERYDEAGGLAALSLVTATYQAERSALAHDPAARLVDR